MGATASMVRWPVTLCRQLADSGLYVIRCDNRDTDRALTVDDRTYDFLPRGTLCSDCADLDSDGARRSEVAVLETVEPDSAGAQTGSRCDHVSGGPTTSSLMCSVAMH